MIARLRREVMIGAMPGGQHAVLHAVLATPPGVNMGMATVELGLLSVAREAGAAIVPRRHPALLKPERFTDIEAMRRRMDTGLAHAVALEELPSPDEGRLLYWGDFHHMRQYVSAVAAADGGNLPRTLRLLLADGADRDVRRRSQSFGTTLLFNSAEDLAAPDYRHALSDLLRDCADVWFRDPISFAMARRLDPGWRPRLGVDPAVLVERPRTPARPRHLAVFLGRTPEAQSALAVLAGRLAQRLETEVEWLPWGDIGGFPKLAAPELRQRLGERSGDEPNVHEVLARLAGAAAVVTDAYHLALLAWSWGIPAVVASGRPDVAPGTANAELPRSVDGGDFWTWRDKREIAASQYGALELLLRREEWSDAHLLEGRVERIMRAVETRVELDVAAAIARDAGRARRELIESWAASDAAEVSCATNGARVSRPESASTSRAVAVVAIHDESRHIDPLIRYLVLEGLEVVVIDHGSRDGSAEQARRWIGHGVIGVHERPYDGVFSLQEQLRWKAQAIAQLEHDWVVHVDADEWLHPASPGDRLVDLFSRADAAGATVVNFEEFTFLPNVELGPADDPRERFCSYYHFAPSPRRLMRAWRSDAGLTNVSEGGHTLTGERLRIHEEQGVLRHYPLLTPGHLLAKYGRVRYAPEELSLGWHHNRVGLHPEDISLDGPAVRRLPRWDSREFDRAAPVSRHCWEPGPLGGT